MADVKSKIVEICIFTRDDLAPKYLLLKRSGTEDIYPGIWQFVTGGIHQGEKAYQAAYREMYEETGLSVQRFFTALHVSIFYDAGYDAVNLSPLFAAEIGDADTPKLSREHKEFRWCLYDDAFDLLVWPGQKQGLEIVHRYIVGEKVAGRLLEITGKISLNHRAPGSTSK